MLSSEILTREHILFMARQLANFEEPRKRWGVLILMRENDLFCGKMKTYLSEVLSVSSKVKLSELANHLGIRIDEGWETGRLQAEIWFQREVAHQMSVGLLD